MSFPKPRLSTSNALGYKRRDKVNGFHVKSCMRMLTILLLLCNYGYARFDLDIDSAKHATRMIDSLEKKKVNIIVYDQNNNPLVSASVRLQGSEIGYVTDSMGKLELLIEEGKKLVVEHVGYSPQIFKIDNKVLYIIQMLPGNDKELDDVVVVGYGKQKKESVIGAISTVSSKDLTQSNTQLSQGFAGRLAGVIALSPSGEPGNNASNFWIRGVATLGNTTPLIFLDGIEISIADMNKIDPSNIESFSILKDASATALYGAKGANGVLLITLKHGKIAEMPKITSNIENIFNSPTKVVKFTDAVNFMNLYNEAIHNDDPYAIAKYSEDKISGTEGNRNAYIYPNVDWYNLLFKKYTSTQHANVNIRGGSKNARYYSGIAYYKENGMLNSSPSNNFNNNIINERFNFVNNVDVNVTKSTIVELNLNADFVKYNGPATTTSDLFTEVMRSNPVNFPAYFPSDTSSHILFGNITGGFYTNGTFQNPYADMVKGYMQSFSSTILANLRMTQNLDFFTKGLSANIIASIKNWSYSSITRSYTPYYYMLTSYSRDNATGLYNYNINLIGTGGVESLTQSGSNDGDRTIYLQGTLNYNRTFGSHSFNGLFVYQQKEYDINLPGSTITDALPQRTQGLAGSIKYGLSGTYFFEGNFGYTGSDNFAVGKRWGFFPSFGAGYIVSNEKFFDPLKNWISNLKLRFSYGLVGNDRLPTGRFPYLGTVSLSSGYGYTFGQNYNSYYSGVSIIQLENKDVQWEVSKKMNIGMDLSIKRDLNLTFDFFHESRDKIFQQRATVPSTVGVGSVTLYGNIDKVINKGFDLNLNYGHSFNKDFMFSAKGTFTYAKNKVIYYDEPNYLYPYLFIKGRPVNQLWGLQADRLFSDANEVANSPTQTYNSIVNSGDIKYKNVSAVYGDDNQIDDNDKVPMGHPSVPEITYGFGVNFQYKKWDLGIFMQGVANVSFFMNGIDPFGEYQRNVLDFVAKDHWSNDNQNLYAMYPRLSSVGNLNNTQNSSWWLRSAAFIRLKNAEIGYSYSKIARFYARGINVLTFSSFKAWDPELSTTGANGNGLGYPPQRQIAVGVQLNFN